MRSPRAIGSFLRQMSTNSTNSGLKCLVGKAGGGYYNIKSYSDRSITNKGNREWGSLRHWRCTREARKWLENWRHCVPRFGQRDRQDRARTARRSLGHSGPESGNGRCRARLATDPSSKCPTAPCSVGLLVAPAIRLISTFIRQICYISVLLC